MRLRPSQARGRSPGARYLASAAALLLLLGQLASYEHLLTVRHEVCAEHGELIDVHQGPAAEGSQSASSGGQFTRSSRPEVGHQHEHCALAPHRRESSAALQPRATVCAAPPPLVSRLTSAPLPLQTARQAVYRLAPKNSPPV